jgi:cytochrome c peroxidase
LAKLQWTGRNTAKFKTGKQRDPIVDGAWIRMIDPKQGDNRSTRGRPNHQPQRNPSRVMTRQSIRVLSTVTVLLAGATAAAIMISGTGVAAIVGQTRKVDIPPQTDQSVDQLRNEYRRPQVIPFPKDNPYTVEKANLGKKLFFDTRLSAANLLSCGACHNPAYGFGDGQPTGVGHGMKSLARRSPSIINSAYGLIFMWDGRAESLEEQALGPIRADVEMNLPIDQLLQRLKGIPEYGPLFEAAFPKQSITPQTIAKAIATYERTVVSGRAPFDEWIDGDDKAISEDAKRGFLVFNTKGKCSACHSGWKFTDDSFHDIGLASEDIGAVNSCPASSRWNGRSRPRDCARSPAADLTCTTAPRRRSKRSWSTMSGAGLIARAARS